MLRKLRKNYKRMVAFMLTVAMVFTNVNVAFAAGEEQEALFLIDGEDLWEAVELAVGNGETFRFSSLELTTRSKSLKTSYEKLIGEKSGKVYQLDVDVDERYAPEDTSVEVFYNADTEAVIFLFINESDMVVRFRANVGGLETARVTVNPNTANVDDNEASYAEDYSNTTMIDDMPETVGAEVLSPTTEAADANETSEAAEQDDDETIPVESETEESTTDGSGAEETVEENETTVAEETAEDDDEVSDVAETTAAANEPEAEDTREEAEAEEIDEVAEADEPEVDSDADVEEAEEVGQDADSEKGSEIASISIRKLQQVASGFRKLENVETDNEPEDIPEDQAPEIPEESESGEQSSAAEEEPAEPDEAEPEDAVEGGAEAVSEAETAEVTEDESETVSEAESRETMEDVSGASDEAEAEETTTAASGEAAGVETDESTADGTEDSAVPGDRETADPVETSAAGTTEKAEETAPADKEGSDHTDGDIPDQNEGQELENDIDGSLQIFGTLQGKAYDTVTIWNSANARAYKVSLDEFADIEMEDLTPAMPEMTLEGSAGSMDVTINSPEGAFPENTTVQVEAVDADEVADAVAESLYEAGMDIVSIEAADITFYDEDSEEIQPESRVEVVFSNVDTESRATRAFVYHICDDGKADCVEEADPDAGSIFFQADAFSVYAVVRTTTAQQTMRAMLSANGDETVPVKVKVVNQEGYQSAMLPVGVIRDNAGNMEGVPADYQFISAKVGNTEIYEVAVGDDGTYVTTAENQLAGSRLKDGQEIILYYKKEVTEYHIEYKVSVNGGEAILANGSGEVKAVDPATGSTVIYTKVIGPDKVDAEESLNFSFSKKDGYIVKGVSYKMGEKKGNLGTGHKECLIEKVTDSVTVTISLEKVTEYNITFHGSNTSFSFGEPDVLKWEEDGTKQTATAPYTVGSSLHFEVWPNNFDGWSDKILSRLTFTMDGRTAGTDIPQTDGGSKETVLPNGTVVTVVRHGRTVTNPEDHLQYDAPRYSVTVRAAEGDEILGGMDVAASCKERTEGTAEVRAVSLVGVEALPYHIGDGKLHFNEDDLLNPETLISADWNGVRDFRAFIKVKEGYSTSKKPKVTIEYNGVREVLDDDEIKPLTGIGDAYSPSNNYYGMATAYGMHYQYYFTIPYEKGKGINDIRIYINALRDQEQFEVHYDYNGGSDVYGNTRIYVDRGSSETDYEFDKNGGSTEITVEAGKLVPPTKDGYEFAGWELQRATDGKRIYQSGDTFNAIKAHMDTVARLNGSTGSYQYDFVAKWLPMQYTVKVTFVDTDASNHSHTVKWTEAGLPGSTVNVKVDGILDRIRNKVDSGQIKGTELPEGWNEWYEFDGDPGRALTVDLGERDSGFPEIQVQYKLVTYHVKVAYTCHRQDLKADETVPVMPENVNLTVKNGEVYRVVTPVLNGWIADIKEVSGKINKNDVNVEVTYHKDANRDKTPDCQQSYSLTVTYKYEEKDLEAGEKAPRVPDPYRKSGLAVGEHLEVVPDKVKGWVAVPGKVTVDIYDRNITREVTYRKDANGDNIPDDCQVTITYRVEHGNWNTGGNDTVTEILTLRKGGVPSVDGTAFYTAPKAGSDPIVGYKAGAWNVANVPTRFTKADDNTTYTYSYVKNGFRLTVKHEYTAVDGTRTERFLVDNADIEFEKALSYKADSADNYTFTGVEVEGLTDTNTAPGIVEGSMPANRVVIIFHYDEDSKGTVDPDKGDGIPDKYQITFTYEAAGKGGEVTGTTREVRNLYNKFQRDANGFVTASGYAKVHPTIPATVTVYDSYYFLNWLDGRTVIGNDEQLKAGSYDTDKVFTATFHEAPNNSWKVTKDVVNLPARGYFRVGEEARFVITVENVGNRALKNVRIEEQQGVAFVPSGDYRIEDGAAVLDTLDLKEVVRLEAVYKVTREDLFHRQFRNIVQSTAEFTVVEPGTPEVLTPVTADSGPVPAGAQGGGSGGSGGGGGGSSTRSPGTGGGAAGGPGTVNIDPEEVPLAGLPDMGRVEILALIDDEEDVPLAALPKTGQAASAAMRLMLSSIMLAAAAVVTRKRGYES